MGAMQPHRHRHPSLHAPWPSSVTPDAPSGGALALALALALAVAVAVAVAVLAVHVAAAVAAAPVPAPVPAVAAAFLAFLAFAAAVLAVSVGPPVGSAVDFAGSLPLPLEVAVPLLASKLDRERFS